MVILWKFWPGTKNGGGGGCQVYSRGGTDFALFHLCIQSKVMWYLCEGEMFKLLHHYVLEVPKSSPKHIQHIFHVPTIKKCLN